MKRRFWIFAIILSLALTMTACAGIAEKPAVNIAVLKGPTGMGAVSLMAINDAGEASNQYTFTIAGAPDVVVSQLITGELDIAALPTNTIALLSQKTNGQVQALAVNTLGVLYLLEKGDTVQSIDDLAGKTIVAAGQGTTTEAIAGLLFPNATIEYTSEHAEAISLAVSGKYDTVLVPEPFVTSLLKQDAGFRVALNMTEAWETSGAGMLPMGGIAVRKDFAQNNADAIAAFLAEYAESVAYANENPAEAAKLIEQYEIMKAAVAQDAIPRANMVCLTGDEMKDALTGFYNVLFEHNPALIGGILPGDGFYYVAP